MGLGANQSCASQIAESEWVFGKENGIHTKPASPNVDRLGYEEWHWEDLCELMRRKSKLLQESVRLHRSGNAFHLLGLER